MKILQLGCLQAQNISTGKVLGWKKGKYWAWYGKNTSPIKIEGSWWCRNSMTTKFEEDTQKGSAFHGISFKKTLTMLSTGFRAQAYTPLLWQPIDWTQSQPTAWQTSSSARRAAFGPDALRGSKSCCKNLDRIMVPSHPAVQTAKSHSFPSNHKTINLFCVAAA